MTQLQYARLWMIIAGLNGAFGVAIGAYGWHALDESPQYLRESFNIGVQYHMWHTLALIGIAWLCERGAGVLANIAGASFCLGIVLFSGTLYYFGLNSELFVRHAAPIGGASYIFGWLAFTLAAYKLAK